MKTKSDEGPTISARFQKYPDARDDEYHGGGIAGLAVGLVFLVVIAWWALA